MTLGGFIEYLLDNDCDIARDIDCSVLQIKRRGKIGFGNKITIPYADKTKIIKPLTVCRVCRTLDVNIPNDAKHADEILIFILDLHKKGRNEKV